MRKIYRYRYIEIADVSFTSVRNRCHTAATFFMARRIIGQGIIARTNMCGIVGYVGARDATPLLIEGLRRLEYRGYDSAGIAVLDQGTETRVVRCRGKLSALEKLLVDRPP